MNDLRKRGSLVELRAAGVPVWTADDAPVEGRVQAAIEMRITTWDWRRSEKRGNSESPDCVPVVCENGTDLGMRTGE